MLIATRILKYEIKKHLISDFLQTDKVFCQFTCTCRLYGKFQNRKVS